MSKRVGGFINQDGLNAPDEPTNVTASAGDAQATVSFTAPSDVGASAITGYVATSDDGIGATGSSSPITVTGLTNDTAYTFRVWALNAFGYSAPSGVSGSVTPQLQVGLIAGGFGVAGAVTNSIDTISIGSAANATDFGDLTIARGAAGGCSSSTRGLFGGGYTASEQNVIDYVTFASAGNAIDFGDLTTVRRSLFSGSSSTRGVWAGGSQSANTGTNVIAYVTIASAGNATDFGDLTVKVWLIDGSCASPTRLVFSGGFNDSNANVDVMGFITTATTGNATDFGDLSAARRGAASCSSSTRGLIGGGFEAADVNTIELITIASAGNATDFGDLTVARTNLTALSSSSRGVWAGGDSGGGATRQDTIDFVTIASAGNATDFGDLTSVRQEPAACSSAHGGLS